MSRRSARLRQKSSPPPPPAKPPTSVSPVSSEDELEKLYRLSDNWLELESDPGVFTLLVNDFGCTEVEIEEIYDINLPFKNKVFGFIFLFNYTLKNSRSRHSSCLVESGTFITDETFLTEHFFAHQIVPNSCATHALLSVLLNCADIEIGASLSSFKNYVMHMSPEDKGLAILNVPQLAKAHNSHAAPQNSSQLLAASDSKSNRYNSSSTSTSGNSAAVFHYVSFVPINGHLIELDGLKKFPIDHGEIGPNETWTDKFRSLFLQKLDSLKNSKDIRYNLMAVVPNRYQQYSTYARQLKKLQLLLTNFVDCIKNLNNCSIISEHNYFDFSTLETINQQLIFDHEMVTFVPYYDCPLDGPEVESKSLSQQYSSPAFINCLETIVLTEDGHFPSLTLVLDRVKNIYLDGPISLGPITAPLLADLLQLNTVLEQNIQTYHGFEEEERRKYQKYICDNQRRVHNYDQLITTFLAMLSELGLLEKFITGTPLAEVESSDSTIIDLPANIGDEYHYIQSNEIFPPDFDL